ncbi:MAG: hypothetical protein AVDCRST_MAG59-2658, partial [uncultured Thermomicrobiales bacterium]
AGGAGAGGPGPLQRRDRRGPLRQPPHRHHPRHPRLRQARRRLAGRGRRPRPARGAGL